MTAYSPMPISARQTGAPLEQLDLHGGMLSSSSAVDFSPASGYDNFKRGSLPSLLLGLNLLGAVAHGMGIFLVQTQARLHLELPIWHYKMNNTNTTESPVWTREAEITYINPSAVITLFFSLSCAFHVFISVFLMLLKCNRDAWYAQWYLKGLYHNIAIWRWAEYFFSAPIMLLLAAPLIGIREIHTIWAVVGSIGVTILFGWITELHGLGLIVSEQDPKCICNYSLYRRWRTGSWKTRLQIHLLGYVPYALCWAIVFDRFRLNMESAGDYVPDFVNSVVIGCFVIFTLFGLTQFVHQFWDWGPSVYWIGEVIYVVLSFTAKATLGFVVLYQSLVEGGRYDTVLQFKVNNN